MDGCRRQSGVLLVCMFEIDDDDSSTGTIDEVVVIVVEDVRCCCCSALCDTRGNNERMTMGAFREGSRQRFKKEVPISLESSKCGRVLQCDPVVATVAFRLAWLFPGCIAPCSGFLSICLGVGQWCSPLGGCSVGLVLASSAPLII